MVQSVDRALRILQALAVSDTMQPLSVIAERVEVPSSTAHRLLSSLRKQGFVRYDANERTYGVGLGILPIARAAQLHTPIYHEAEPLLKQLAARVNETATLVVLNGEVGTYALMAKSERSMTLTASPGEVVPLHATASGKVMLAHLPEERLNTLLSNHLAAYTPNTITNPLRMKEELALVRAQGYAVDAEERELGMCCIAAPVFNYMGIIIAALGISGPSSRISAPHHPELAAIVREVAEDLTTRLGYRRPAGAKGNRER